MEEATRVADALLREGLSSSLQSAGGKLLNAAVTIPAETAKMILPKSLRVLGFPLLLPSLLSKGAQQFSRKSEEDEAVLATLRSLQELSMTALPADTNGPSLSAPGQLNGLLAQQLLSSDSLFRRQLQDGQLSARAPLVGLLSRKFASSLLERIAQRIDESTGLNSHIDSSGSTSKRAPLSAAPSKREGRRGEEEFINSVGFVGARTARVASLLLRPSPPDNFDEVK